MIFLVQFNKYTTVYVNYLKISTEKVKFRWFPRLKIFTSFLWLAAKMSPKHIIATFNVILALLIRFSTQLNHSQSDTYQTQNEWSIETNLLDFDDDSNEQLMAFSKFSSSYLLSIVCCFCAPSRSVLGSLLPERDGMHNQPLEHAHLRVSAAVRTLQQTEASTLRQQRKALRELLRTVSRRLSNWQNHRHQRHERVSAECPDLHRR